MKSLTRLIQISWIIGGYFVWLGLVNVRLLHSKKSPALKLTHLLEKLGTTFIKLGQGLSLHQDILPDDYVHALQGLQDHVQPFPGKIAKQEIEIALGDSVENIFAEFSIEPLAAASIAQVHKAVLHDGRAVIVKVRRPGLETLIKRDIQLLMRLLYILEWIAPGLQQYKLLEIVSQSGLTLMQELDFRKELRNIIRFHTAFKDSETIHIPAAIPELSTENILVQMLSGGRLVTDSSIRDQGAELAAHFFDAYLYQLFTMGYIHGDPHPGNIFIMGNGKICIHDFGLVGHIDQKTRRLLIGFFLALVNQDSDWLLNSYIDLGMLDANIDRDKARSGLAELMLEHNDSSLKDWSLASIMLQTIRMDWGRRLHIPYQLLIFMRTLFMIEATLRNLDLDFKMVKYLKDYGAPVMIAALQFKNEGANTLRAKYELANLYQDLPSTVMQLTRDIKTRGLAINVRHHGLEDIEKHIDRSSNRISMALLALGLYIASAILTQSQLPPVVAGIPLIALSGYLLALWVTVKLLLGISRSERL